MSFEIIIVDFFFLTVNRTAVRPLKIIKISFQLSEAIVNYVAKTSAA